MKKHFVAFHLSALDSSISQRVQVSDVYLSQPSVFFLLPIRATAIVSYHVLAKTVLTSPLGLEGGESGLVHGGGTVKVEKGALLCLELHGEHTHLLTCISHSNRLVCQ